ncbi:lysozyme inhibitor LprI family protein [Blastochloris viridis]|uniref:Lysozyme inhibitor LprI-like N-terminal domain-containing protein n=1 Tax=Blastochloris viridis TaxID=1079 RepID=A0A182D2I1_BLAVI|nr:lysozyme inhibitor LprI family protein [Blastochloris viridis]ALK10487.1 hypothetical protein BVIR_2722 [Blastochloris viridis]BAR99568.1 hypothetical protein BV133_1975 [Blastochloris viridis]
MLALVVAGGGAAAEDGPDGQGAAPAVRQIAPGFIPHYNLDDPAGVVQKPRFEVVLPTRERPLGGCESSLSPAVFGRCLAATLQLSRRTLEGTVIAAQAAIAARDDLSAGHRARWSQVLAEVHLAWKAARNLECGQLVVLERGPNASIFEERTGCLLAAERDRIDDLKRRYGLD